MRGFRTAGDGGIMEAQEGKSVVNALRHVDCEVLGGYDALCVESS